PARPRLVIPVAALDPAAARYACCVRGETPRKIPLVDRRAQVDPDEFLGAADEMHVRVVEARHEQTTARVDRAGAGARESPYLFVRTDRGDALPADGHSVRRWPSRVDGVDLRVDNDEVSRARLGHDAGRHRER